MPSDEGRRRQIEAELYAETERRKAEEAQRQSQERLRGFHRAVTRNIQEREQRIAEIRKRFDL
jgi:hypothetical protein